MTITKRIRDFIAQEDGAITSDFVLLTGLAAGVLAMTMGSFSAVTFEVADFTASMLTSGSLVDLIH